MMQSYQYKLHRFCHELRHTRISCACSTNFVERLLRHRGGRPNGPHFFLESSPPNTIFSSTLLNTKTRAESFFLYCAGHVIEKFVIESFLASRVKTLSHLPLEKGRLGSPWSEPKSTALFFFFFFSMKNAIKQLHVSKNILRSGLIPSASGHEQNSGWLA